MHDHVTDRAVGRSRTARPTEAGIDAVSPRHALRASLRRPLALALGLALFCFGGSAAWSTLAPLASAAVASGTISPEGHRRTVQHLEGGIVREILVADGDRVETGQPLLVLDDLQALARYRMQQARLVALGALAARLRAEESSAAQVDWSVVPDGPDRAEAIADQQAIFAAGLATRASWGEILEQRIAQLEREIEGLEAQIDSADRQLALIAQEVAMVSELLRKGLARMPRLLALQRSQAEVDGRRAANRASIARAVQAIGEAELQILALEVSRRDDAARQLGDVGAELAEVEERMTGARDVLARTLVKAPVAGTVFALRHTTLGGVIKPGEPILDIVPGGDDLLVDAWVSPADIDVVTIGLEADVALTAYPQRNLPRLSGRVRQVSADRLTDELSGETYYLARIEVDGDALAALDGGIELLPGMPADVMIYTGTQTLFDYLAGPLVASLRKSLREG